MTDYDALITAADNDREHYRLDAAITKYHQAWLMGGPRDRYCAQMNGVSYRMKHKYVRALWWFDQARAGANDLEDGNILRDMGEAHSGLGDFNSALDCFAKSLQKLPEELFPSEYAITLSFKARTEMRAGKMTEALRHFNTADVMLARQSDRKLELYHKLHYADALSQLQHPVLARWLACQSFMLALRYGAWPHRIRAALLIIGGHRLYDFFRNRFRP